MQNLESAKKPSSNGYEAGGGEPNRQVHTLLLNQPKPPTMLPRRNDDDKGSISNFENETQLELLTIFFLTKKTHITGANLKLRLVFAGLY